MALETCCAPVNTSTRCPRRGTVNMKVKVPGGNLRGSACASHALVVRQMLMDEAARRTAAAA